MNRTPVADWQQLSALYEQADALAPEALAAWLGELRRQLHPLLAQLEQMLQARQQIRSNGFLGTLPQVPIAPEPREFEWQAGARVGPYRMLRKLGSGGMADVWLAERDDGAFQRQVAIKLLFRHAGSPARDTFERRFERERDILASLNHPHIACLHDAGVTHAGQPWLALEYVEGETLTAWCDARSLPLADRVKLFRQVLMAVQHAHANLIIHRDLKPGNILVSSQGEVRLLDFGIAKLMEPEGGPLAETELTRLAGRPMTPQYASPEQLTGQPLTTGSDVYSLGVVLYELLCGDRPYELRVESTAQLEQAILEVDPRPPSRRAILEPAAVARGTTGAELRRALGSDLDAIVLRALAKKPAQRYGSVEALGADLDRWLEGKPVEARAPSTLYRAGKFVRRHTLAVTLSGGAVVALVAVTVLAVAMGMQAREDSARAVAARDFMLNIFKLADKEKAHGAEITAKDVLESGRNDILTSLAGQPRLQAELLRGIASIQDNMGEYAAADTTFAELVRTWASLHEPREEALARLDRGWNALGMYRTDLARRQLDETLAQPDRPQGDNEVNAALAQLSGLLELDAGASEQARSRLVLARQNAIETLGEGHLRTLWLGQALFRANKQTGRIDEALALQESLRRAAKSIHGLSAVEYANLDWEEVDLLYESGQFDSAIHLLAQALPNCVNALGRRFQLCRYLRLRSTEILTSLGWTERAKLEMPELLSSAEDGNLPYLQVHSWLVQLRLLSAEPDASPEDRRRAITRIVGFVNSDDPDKGLRADAMLGLAESSMRFGDWDQGEAWVEKASALLQVGLDEYPKSLIGAKAEMLSGVALLGMDHVDEAIGRLQTARGYLSANAGDARAATQLISMNLALALERKGDSRSAALLSDRALALLPASIGKENPLYARIVELSARSKANPVSDAPNARPHDGRASSSTARDFYNL